MIGAPACIARPDVLVAVVRADDVERRLAAHGVQVLLPTSTSSPAIHAQHGVSGTRIPSATRTCVAVASIGFQQRPAPARDPVGRPRIWREDSAAGSARPPAGLEAPEQLVPPLAPEELLERPCPLTRISVRQRAAAPTSASRISSPSPRLSAGVMYLSSMKMYSRAEWIARRTESCTEASPWARTRSPRRRCAGR